jgi:hypothetical protein
LSSHVGKKYRLLRDIITAGGFSKPISFEVTEKEIFLVKNQFKFAIQKNSAIRITSIVQRRLDAGVNYYFVCIVEETQQKFDLQFDMRDCLGIQ